MLVINLTRREGQTNKPGLLLVTSGVISSIISSISGSWFLYSQGEVEMRFVQLLFGRFLIRSIFYLPSEVMLHQHIWKDRNRRIKLISVEQIGQMT